MDIIRPDSTYRESFLTAWDEFDEEGADAAEWMGAFGLTREQIASAEGFEALCAYHLRQETEADPGRVTATMLWAVEDGEWLGRVSIRHELTDFLRRVGGHIGYAVRPRARRRGIGGVLMQAGLNDLAARGVASALVTCDDDNVASYRIIESAGGLLEDVVEGKRRYWVPTGPAVAVEHLLILPELDDAEELADELAQEGFEVRVVREAAKTAEDDEDIEWAVHVVAPRPRSANDVKELRDRFTELAHGLDGWYDSLGQAAPDDSSATSDPAAATVPQVLPTEITGEASRQLRRLDGATPA